MGMHIDLTTHVLPIWFLVFALFLPRISLLLYWLMGGLTHFSLHTHIGNGIDKWIPLVLAVVLPRILVLILIYQDQGIGMWFVVHLIALFIVWGGSGHYHSRRWDN
jgi:hypothetical protein